MTVRQYALTTRVLNRIINLNKNSCRLCNIPFKINDIVVSRSWMSNNMGTYYYHKRCAEKVNII